MTVTHSNRCRDLAVLFLSNEPELLMASRIAVLAGLIQMTIEDYIAVAKEREE